MTQSLAAGRFDVGHHREVEGDLAAGWWASGLFGDGMVWEGCVYIEVGLVDASECTWIRDVSLRID